MNNNPHIGSSFEDFLEEEGILEQVDAIAQKRVIAWQLRQAMAQRRLSKTAMAKQMQTSRSALERLLDPDNTSITLLTMEKAAKALGLKLKIEFEECDSTIAD